MSREPVIDRYPYRDWLKAAERAPDQDAIWRQHESFIREHMATDDERWIDLGGEA